MKNPLELFPLQILKTLCIFGKKDTSWGTLKSEPRDLTFFVGGYFSTIEWDQQPLIIKVKSWVFMNNPTVRVTNLFLTLWVGGLVRTSSRSEGRSVTSAFRPRGGKARVAEGRCGRPLEESRNTWESTSVTRTTLYFALTSLLEERRDTWESTRVKVTAF